MKTKTKLFVIIALITLAIVIALTLWYRNLHTKVSTFSTKDESSNIAKAKEFGDDVRGWLRVEGTNIDMALITVDEDTNLIKGDYDFAWTNSFPDQKSNRPAFISHNIRNVSRNPIIGDDTMSRFEQLMSFIYPSFIEENQFIEYTNSEGKTSLYRIYGVALLDDDQNSSYSDTYSKKEQQSYIKRVKKESMYDIDTDVNEDDLLLTLFTCTRFYGSSTNYSFRVDARELRKEEEKIYAKITPNENYEVIKERMEEGDENEEV